MTLPHTAEAKAWTEQMCSAAFQFVIPSTFATPNTQVKPSPLTAVAAPNVQLSPTSTISPGSARALIFCTPNGSVAGNAANQNTLPRGVSPGATSPAGSEFLIDFSGFPADIVNVTANLVGVSRGANVVECSVSCIDNVNKLVYLQTYNTTSGAAAAATAGQIVACQVVLQDSYSA